MQGNPPEDGRRHTAEPRVHGREEIRHPTCGKPAKTPEFGLPRQPQREGLSPDACHSLGGRHRDREVSSAFCALWSQIKLPALHRGHFGGLPAALGTEALQGVP